jgi:hypothetical protein
MEKYAKKYCKSTKWMWVMRQTWLDFLDHFHTDHSWYLTSSEFSISARSSSLGIIISTSLHPSAQIPCAAFSSSSGLIRPFLQVASHEVNTLNNASIPLHNFSQIKLYVVGQWIVFHSHTAMKYETCVESVSCSSNRRAAKHKHSSWNSRN